MKILPKILALYVGDYQRQRYGKIFVWMLLISLAFLLLIAVVAQTEFQEVLYKKGQVVSVENQQNSIAFDIPSHWVTKVKSGNTVVLIDNDSKTVNAIITQIKRKKNSDIQLVGLVSCDECQLVFSQWVELHIITGEISVLDMFMATVNKDAI